MFTSIKALFLSIILFFLNIPYDIDAPTRAFIQSSSLDQTAIVCEQTASGAEATFTLSMKQAYRVIKSDYPYYEVNVQLFDSLDGIDLSRSGKLYDSFQVIGMDEYADKSYRAATAIEIKDAPDIIKAFDTFTLVVRLKLAPTVPAGTYHLAVSPNYGQECIYPDAVVVKQQKISKSSLPAESFFQYTEIVFLFFAFHPQKQPHVPARSPRLQTKRKKRPAKQIVFWR